jgi:hypothetical protein
MKEPRPRQANCGLAERYRAISSVQKQRKRNVEWFLQYTHKHTNTQLESSSVVFIQVRFLSIHASGSLTGRGGASHVSPFFLCNWSRRFGFAQEGRWTAS